MKNDKAKIKSGISSKVGLSPGSLVYVGPESSSKPIRITVIDYNKDSVSRYDDVPVEKCASFNVKDSVTWINVDGVHDVRVIETIGRQFDIPALILEDIVHIGQRPKVEIEKDLLYVVAIMVRYDPELRTPSFEQVSIVVTPSAVITFQEREGDVFDPVRERLSSGSGRIRSMGVDYLCYALLDTIVDHIFVVLEEVSERIEAVDGKVLSNPQPETLHEIHRLKHGIIMMRKAIWPLRDVLTTLSRNEHPLLESRTMPYIRDLLDHSMRVIETLETYRELVSGLLDTYLSSVGNRTNEVMKVLTIMATIFIPLTFVVGVYGMNFEYMPELKWRFGYAMVWVINILIALTLLIIFKIKRWI